MNEDKLHDEISELISLGAEGEYWDFKRDWYDNSALLHDIICMANNLSNRDAYIIIGVDNCGSVLGVTGKDRKNQQNVIDFLKDKNFAGGVRPTVYVRPLKIESRKIDVIIIKNSTHTPYYLTDDYRGVLKGNIYTRIGDTNTPKIKTADIDKVIILWKKRFGIDLIPLKKMERLLINPKDWLPMGTDGKHSTNNYKCRSVWYNKANPEFTISYRINEGQFDKGRIDVVESSMFWMNKLPRPLHNAYVYELSVNYHSTVMYSSFAVSADGFRFERLLWKSKPLLRDSDHCYIQYAFIEKDSLEFLLDVWLCNRYETIQQTEDSCYSSPLKPWRKCYSYLHRNPYAVVPVFESSEEHKLFIEYVNSKSRGFLEIVGNYSFEHSQYKNSQYIKVAYPDYIDYLCKVGETLVNWLSSWRQNLPNYTTKIGGSDDE